MRAMFKNWVHILLYVTANASIPTNRDLWKPSHPVSLFRPVLARVGLPYGNPEDPPITWVRQHLVAWFDLTLPHRYALPWMELNKPNIPARRDLGLSRAVGEDASINSKGIKEHLRSIPSPRTSHERNLHSYRFAFSGQVSAEGGPSRGTSVVLRLATPTLNVIRKTSTDPNGHYEIGVPLDALDNENVLWWLHAENGQGRSPDFEGSRILSQDRPDNTIEKDLTLSTPQS